MQERAELAADGSVAHLRGLFGSTSCFPALTHGAILCCPLHGLTVSHQLFSTDKQMIEIIILIIIVPLIRRLAKERNKSVAKWIFAAIGAAMAAEIIVGLILVKLGLMRRILIENNVTSQALYLLLYALLTASAAATGATLVIRQLRKKPITQS